MNIQKEQDFSHIILTAEEERNAINYFKMLKARQMDEQERIVQRSLKIAEAQKPWTYDQLKADILKRAEALPFSFVIDRENERIFHLLCLYFSNDARFEEFTYTGGTGEQIPFKLTKGIALLSKTKGTGKSVLMQLFSRNKKRPFATLPTMDIAAEYKRHEEKALNLYSSTLYVAPNPNLFYCQHLGICFEDLGLEQVKNSYGNKSDVMLDILFKVYENGKLHGDYSAFHLTSNLTGDEFEARYDARIRSRMREMFNFLELPGKDRRK